MQRAVIKSSDLVPRAPSKDLLAQGLIEVIRAGVQLLQRINTQISSATHAEVVDDIALFRECELCLKEYVYIANAALKIVRPVESKIQLFYKKQGFLQDHSFPAHSWSPVILLNLLREQAIGKRQQEIQEIEKRKKDIIQKLEADVTACKNCFTEMVPRMNLLCYMRDCYKHDHALPATVMYQTNIKKTVRSPFEPEAPVVKTVPSAKAKTLPQGMVHTKEGRAEKPNTEELSPRELLLKMRAMQLEEREQKREAAKKQ